MEPSIYFTVESGSVEAAGLGGLFSRRFGELEEAAAEVERGRVSPVDVLLQMSLVIDEGKGDQVELAEGFEDGMKIEDAVGIEFDAFAADGDGEVEAAAGSKDALEVVDEGETGMRIDGVRVAAEAEVFGGVEAGERIDAVIGKAGQAGCIVLNELEAGDFTVHGPDIDDGDGHENEEMGDEAVEAGGDIGVGGGAALVDFFRGPEVGVEVLAMGFAGWGGLLVEDGPEFAELEAEGRRARRGLGVDAHVPEKGGEGGEAVHPETGVKAGVDADAGDAAKGPSGGREGSRHGQLRDFSRWKALRGIHCAFGDGGEGGSCLVELT